MEKKYSFLKGLLTGLLGAAVLAVIIFAVKIIVFDRTDNQTSAILNKAEAVREIIDEYYLEDADAEALADAMYKGMVESWEINILLIKQQKNIRQSWKVCQDIIKESGSAYLRMKQAIRL
jgi:demethoxyubiquinone hydroxylase (CLK1/Coq7/Cat5 family)